MGIRYSATQGNTFRFLEQTSPRSWKKTVGDQRRSLFRECVPDAVDRTAETAILKAVQHIAPVPQQLSPTQSFVSPVTFHALWKAALPFQGDQLAETPPGPAHGQRTQHLMNSHRWKGELVHIDTTSKRSTATLLRISSCDSHWASVLCYSLLVSREKSLFHDVSTLRRTVVTSLSTTNWLFDVSVARCQSYSFYRESRPGGTGSMFYDFYLMLDMARIIFMDSKPSVHISLRLLGHPVSEGSVSRR